MLCRPHFYLKYIKSGKKKYQVGRDLVLKKKGCKEISYSKGIGFEKFFSHYERVVRQRITPGDFPQRCWRSSRART
jgi:hypothetical protein